MTEEYVIENSTDYRVQIVYRFETMDKIPAIRKDTIEIDANSVYREYKSAGFQSDDPGILPFTTDSVVIRFDDEKEIVQVCERFFIDSCNIERNIVNYNNQQNYTRTTISKKCGTKAYRYTYVINEEDYNDALPLEK